MLKKNFFNRVKLVGLMLMLTLSSTNLLAQPIDARTASKIKVKFINANKFFEEKSYDKALQKIVEVEKLLGGKPSATALNLKIKIMVAREQYTEADDMLDVLYELSPSVAILTDIAKYSEVIDEKIGPQKRLKEACNDSDSSACNELAAYYWDDGSSKGDGIRAGELYKKSCDVGNAEGCYNLGYYYTYGYGGVEKNLIRAGDFFKKSCDGGSGNACVSFAHKYYKGNNVEMLHIRAHKLFKKSCDDGSLKDCASLGDQYSEGSGVEKNQKRANKLYEKACNGGNAYGCSALGLQFYYAGDERRSREFKKKACGLSARYCDR